MTGEDWHQIFRDTMVRCGGGGGVEVRAGGGGGEEVRGEWVVVESRGERE